MTDPPGFSHSERLNKLGMRSSDTAQLFFDDVVVPQRFEDRVLWRDSAALFKLRDSGYRPPQTFAWLAALIPAATPPMRSTITAAMEYTE